MREVLTIDESQMNDWKQICRAFAKKQNAELVFVNSTSCGIQTKDGEFHHIYIDEMASILKGE